MQIFLGSLEQIFAVYFLKYDCDNPCRISEGVNSGSFMGSPQRVSGGPHNVWESSPSVPTGVWNKFSGCSQQVSVVSVRRFLMIVKTPRTPAIKFPVGVQRQWGSHNRSGTPKQFSRWIEGNIRRNGVGLFFWPIVSNGEFDRGPFFYFFYILF